MSERTDNAAGRRVIVFGGGGFIGQKVIARLLRDGAQVRVLGRSPKPEALHDAGLAEWVVGSIADEALVATASKGCEAAIFLAWNSLPATANRDLAAEIDFHVKTTIRTAQICDAESVETFVFASSGGAVYGRSQDARQSEQSSTAPLTGYGASKLAVEHYLRVLSSFRRMRTLSLRVSNAYGEGQFANRGQGFVAAAMDHAVSGRPLAVWGDGSVVRDFVYVHDVAAAFAQAVAYRGDALVLNIGSGVGCSLRTMIEKVEAATGRPLLVRFEPGRPIDVAVNVMDVAAAAIELGWEPDTTLDAGLARTASWWLSKSQAA